MAIVEMSLTEALQKKKIYNERLSKTIYDLDNARLFDYRIGSNENLRESQITEEQLKSRIQSLLDSFNSLYSNYRNIMKAIEITNANTKVTIAGQEMSIAEAIALKKSDISTLIGNMSSNVINKYNNLLTKITKLNDQTMNPDKISQYVSMLLANNPNASDNERDSLVETYKTNNTAKLVDPCLMCDVCHTLEQDNSSFINEIDIRLSEVNARTILTVELAD